MATIQSESTEEEIAADGLEILMNVVTAIEASEKGNWCLLVGFLEKWTNTCGLPYWEKY